MSEEESSLRFLNRIHEIENRLDEQKRFITDSLKDPELLFANASDVFKNGTKDTVFNIMSIYEDGQRKMNVHEFQNFLCGIVSMFFEERFPEIDGKKIEVRERNTSNFPSIFAIYYDDVEVIQFDIFEKYYGKRGFQTSEQIVDKYANYVLMYNSERDRLESEITKVYSNFNDPVGYIVDFYSNKFKGKPLRRTYLKWRDIIIYKMISPKKLKDYMNKKLERLERDYEYNESHYANLNRYEEEMYKLNQKIKVLPMLEELFQKYDYTLETQSHKLY